VAFNFQVQIGPIDLLNTTLQRLCVALPIDAMAGFIFSSTLPTSDTYRLDVAGIERCHALVALETKSDR